MRNLRIVLWIAAAVLTVWVLYASTRSAQFPANRSAISLGGPFELIDGHGAPITDGDLLGRSHVLFFGFTHCPQVCPTTLYEASGWLADLGELAGNIDFYFVTVDPARDTPTVLAEYLSAFDPRITAITAPVDAPEAINAIILAYNVYVDKVATGDNDYTVDHTATVFLIDAKGHLASTIAWGEAREAALAKLRRLADSR